MYQIIVGLYFNNCFALKGIVMVWSGVGSSFECVGVAQELTLVKVFFRFCVNNNNCLKSNIQCIEIRVQWTVHLGSSHMPYFWVFG